MISCAQQLNGAAAHTAEDQAEFVAQAYAVDLIAWHFELLHLQLLGVGIACQSFKHLCQLTLDLSRDVSDALAKSAANLHCGFRLAHLNLLIASDGLDSDL